jgi:Sigma-70, region 4
VRAGLEPSLARLGDTRSSCRGRATWLMTSCRRPVCARSSAPINMFPEQGWTDGSSQFYGRSGLTRFGRGGYGRAADLSIPKTSWRTDGAHEIEMNITASAVLRAIDRLPEAQRETVLLVYGEGYSYAEAAATLAVPIGTVVSRLAAVRATLANLKWERS